MMRSASRLEQYPESLMNLFMRTVPVLISHTL
jgi:hypothetical protein